MSDPELGKYTSLVKIVRRASKGELAGEEVVKSWSADAERRMDKLMTNFDAVVNLFNRFVEQGEEILGGGTEIFRFPRAWRRC